ncbi:MAG: serine hydrolase domain-containing protein [Pseudomonadota bacterium]
MFRIAIRLSLSALAAFSSHRVLANDDQRAQAVEKAWRGWMEANGVEASSITMLAKGEKLWSHDTAHAPPGGAKSSSRAAPLASLGKAVTGICVDKLVSAGRLSYDDRVGALLDGFNMAPHAGGITVGQLLTHTSGLFPDQTQGTMARWYGKAKLRHRTATTTALARNQKGEAGVYAYNNENYAVLGQIIAEVTGDFYEDVCRRLVLDPVGVTTASLPKPAGAFGAWGGWSMSTADYARFVQAYFGPSSAMQKNPASRPSAQMGGGANYGPGIVWRRWRGGHNFWHFGLLCDPRGSFGSYTALWKGGYSVVVSFDRCLKFQKLLDLDGALAEAALQ